MHIYIVAHVCIFTHTERDSASRQYLCMSDCVNVSDFYMHTNICAHMYICTYFHTHEAWLHRVRACLLVNMCHTCISKCKFVHIYVYFYIHKTWLYCKAMCVSAWSGLYVLYWCVYTFVQMIVCVYKLKIWFYWKLMSIIYRASSSVNMYIHMWIFIHV